MSRMSASQFIAPRGYRLALALFAIVGCTMTTPEIASVPLQANFRLQIARRPMHQFSAEYAREARLYEGNREVATDSLFPDTGGYGALALYARVGGDYIVHGRFESYVVSTSARTISRVDSDSARGELLGTFDETKDGPWTFSRAAGK